MRPAWIAPGTACSSTSPQSSASDVDARAVRPTLVAGPICESGDVFTQDAEGNPAPRSLPEARVGDILLFHDAGAYGASMASNYNARPLAAEVLIDGESVTLIRRRQPSGDARRRVPTSGRRFGVG
jgi:diaminopimelate decarboxylase